MTKNEFIKIFKNAFFRKKYSASAIFIINYRMEKLNKVSVKEHFLYTPLKQKYFYFFVYFYKGAVLMSQI